MFKNLKLRTKILLPTLVIVALSLTLVSGLLVKWAGEAAVAEAKVLGKETAERHALDVQGFISPIMDQARAMAGIFEAAIKNGQVIDRDSLDQYQLAILEREPSFLGIWTAFEPNALDARDAEFANASKMYDASGRYMPYYFRTNNGIDGHFCSPPEAGLWYTVPRDSQHDYLTNPYSFETDGKMIIGIDSAIPIMVNGTFYGATGIDYEITDFVDLSRTITPFETGRCYIVAADSTFVGHPSDDFVTKPMSDDFGAEVAGKIEAAINAGQSVHMEVSTAAGDMYRVFVPIAVTQTMNWALGVDIPMDKVLAGARVMKWNSIYIGCVVLIVLAAIIYLLAGTIARPITRAAKLAGIIGSGDLSQRLDFDSTDEIGLLAQSLNSMADGLTQKAELAQAIAANDLSGSVQVASTNDVLGLALKKMSTNLNEVIGQVQSAGDQIDAASGQVSASSQSLSEGATETAASLEQISSSMNEMAAQTTHSAENAHQANLLAAEASKAATNGNEQMGAMIDAMSEINEAGQSISKIIKVIDEIAFQTNLLALNAAVEAARAGQHGKGFAVVAEEVRNLAARSAKAASETAGLIQSSVEKTNNGTHIAQQTSEALEEMVGSISKVTDLVAEISVASNEQAQGFSQVNQGLAQIDQGVQQNTATAEESAAAAEELSSQAAQLKHMLSSFTLVAGNSPQFRAVLPVSPSLKSGNGWPDRARNTAVRPSIQLEDQRFGKY
jgi:methyl-accepting chemotaxis protein